MKRSLTITTIVSAACITALFIAASSRSSALQKKIDAYRLGGKAASENSTQKMTPSTTPKGPSVESVLALILEDSASKSLATPIALLPMAVRHVKMCSPGELLELALDLVNAEGLSEDQKRAASTFAMVYLSLAAEQEPAEALDVYDQHLTYKLPGARVRAALLAALAKVDPDTALELADQLPEDSTGNVARTAVFGALLSKDPALGIYLLADREASIASYAASIAALDSSAVNELRRAIQQTPDPKLRTALSLGLLGGTRTDKDFEAARSQFIALNEPDPVTRAAIASQLARGGGATEPEPAIDFAMRELSGEDRVETIAAISGAWAKRDFNATGRWLGELAPSTIRDAAISSFVREVRSIDSDAAKIWTTEIQHQATREAAIRLLTE